MKKAYLGWDIATLEDSRTISPTAIANAARSVRWNDKYAPSGRRGMECRAFEREENSLTLTVNGVSVLAADVIHRFDRPEGISVLRAMTINVAAVPITVVITI
jgi:hypothetical protein